MKFWIGRELGEWDATRRPWTAVLDKVAPMVARGCGMHAAIAAQRCGLAAFRVLLLPLGPVMTAPERAVLP